MTSRTTAMTEFGQLGQLGSDYTVIGYQVRRFLRRSVYVVVCVACTLMSERYLDPSAALRQMHTHTDLHVLASKAEGATAT